MDLQGLKALREKARIFQSGGGGGGRGQEHGQPAGALPPGLAAFQQVQTSGQQGDPIPAASSAMSYHHHHPGNIQHSTPPCPPFPPPPLPPASSSSQSSSSSPSLGLLTDGLLNLNGSAATMSTATPPRATDPPIPSTAASSSSWASSSSSSSSPSPAASSSSATSSTDPHMKARLSRLASAVDAQRKAVNGGGDDKNGDLTDVFSLINAFSATADSKSREETKKKKTEDRACQTGLASYPVPAKMPLQQQQQPRLPPLHLPPPPSLFSTPPPPINRPKDTAVASSQTDSKSVSSVRCQTARRALASVRCQANMDRRKAREVADGTSQTTAAPSPTPCESCRRRCEERLKRGSSSPPPTAAATKRSRVEAEGGGGTDAREEKENSSSEQKRAKRLVKRLNRKELEELVCNAVAETLSARSELADARRRLREREADAAMMKEKALQLKKVLEELKKERKSKPDGGGTSLSVFADNVNNSSEVASSSSPATAVPTATIAILPLPPEADPATQPLSDPAWDAAPPAPVLKLSQQPAGIVLTWNFPKNATTTNRARAASFEIHAYQEHQKGASSIRPSEWKKVGDVQAISLPMACTLTQFKSGNKFHFAVRARDEHGRLGPFSAPGEVHLRDPSGEGEGGDAKTNAR